MNRSAKARGRDRWMKGYWARREARNAKPEPEAKQEIIEEVAVAVVEEVQPEPELIEEQSKPEVVAPVTSDKLQCNTCGATCSKKGKGPKVSACVRRAKKAGKEKPLCEFTLISPLD